MGEAHGTIEGLKSTVKSAVSETLGVTAAITIATMLLVTAIIWTQATHITRPIQIMTNAAQSIVNNADSEDVFEHVRSDQLSGDNDEIGDLVSLQGHGERFGQERRSRGGDRAA